MKKEIILFSLLTIFAISPAIGQQTSGGVSASPQMLPEFFSNKGESILPSGHSFSLVFGMSQPLVLNGFNFEVDYFTERWVFDYSHGFGLELTGDLVSGAAADQGLSLHIPHTLGFGAGYRITPAFNIRIEPKVHLWEVYYNDQFKSQSGLLEEYYTITLGLGAYYKWQPFAGRDGFLSGLTITPNFRWWPNIASSLDNNEFEYFNRITGQTEVHKAMNVGMANSPFFGNVSIGYTFGR